MRLATPRFINRAMPRSLLGRSLLIMITPLILLQVVSTWVFYDSHWDTVTRRLATGVAGDISTVIALMQKDPTPLNYATLFDVAHRTMSLNISFLPGGVLPADPIFARQNLVDIRLTKALNNLVRQPFLIDTRSQEQSVEIHVQLPDGVLRVTAPRVRLFSSTTYIFILWMVGTALLLFAIATIFMSNQVRPIRRLAAIADEFGKGREVQDFVPAGAVEVRQAASAFILMRERIKRQITQRTEMLAGVSHDLRTPLTRMRLAFELLGEDGPAVEELKTDVAAMERMVEGYLDFARGEGPEQPRDTDLSLLIEEAAAEARRDGADISLALPEEHVLLLRPDAMRRCLANLLGNARRYGSHIWVTALAGATATDILIDDDGPGIPLAERENVFRP